MTGRRGGLLRQRNFRLFWTGESISEVGNSVTIVVIPLVAIAVGAAHRGHGERMVAASPPLDVAAATDSAPATPGGGSLRLPRWIGA